MITGHESRELRAEARRRGVLDMIDKPLAFDRLTTALSAIPGRA
jgi:DNA-binding NtrC family response regulator